MSSKRPWSSMRRKKNAETTSSESSEKEETEHHHHHHTKEIKDLEEQCPHMDLIRLERIKRKILTPSMWCCSECGTTEGVWACLICGKIGCGRYQSEHALAHFDDNPDHPLALEINYKYCHCYECDGYVTNDNKKEELETLRKLLENAQNVDESLSTTRSGKIIRPPRKQTPEEFDDEDRLHTAIKHLRLRTYEGAFHRWREFVQESKAAKNKTAMPVSPSLLLRTSTIILPGTPGRYDLTHSQAVSLTKGGRLIPGVTGLRNLGNTCFMNTVLQALSNTADFCNFFLQILGTPTAEGSSPQPVRFNGKVYVRRPTMECFEDASQHIRKEDVSLTMQLHTLLRVLWSGKWAVATPYALLESVWKFVPKFRNRQQQDAQEFLCYLFDRLQIELQENTDKPPTDKLVAEKLLAEKPDRQLADKTLTDKSPTDKSPTDKPPTDKSPTDKSPTDKSPTDKSPTDKSPTDKSPTDKPPTDKPPADKPPADKPPTDIPLTPTDRPPTNKLPTDKDSNSNGNNNVKAARHTTRKMSTRSSSRKKELFEINNNNNSDTNKENTSTNSPSKSNLLRVGGMSQTPTIVTEIFQGRLLSEVLCSHCKNKSTKIDPFLDLSVDIPIVSLARHSRKRVPRIINNVSATSTRSTKARRAKAKAVASTSSVRSKKRKREAEEADGTENGKKSAKKGKDDVKATTPPTKTERSDDDEEERNPEICKLEDCFSSFIKPETLEGYTCDNCHTKTDATKRLFLLSLPRVLCVVLKRFCWTTASRAKIDTQVHFPFVLDVKDYVADGVVHTTYDLTSIVLHHGAGLLSGHYTSYCYNKILNAWVHYNDSRVVFVTKEEIEREAPSKAYLLFYERRNNSTSSLLSAPPKIFKLSASLASLLPNNNNNNTNNNNNNNNSNNSFSPPPKTSK